LFIHPSHNVPGDTTAHDRLDAALAEYKRRMRRLNCGETSGMSRGSFSLGAGLEIASTSTARRPMGRVVSWSRVPRIPTTIEQPLSVSDSTPKRYTQADPDVRLMLQVRENDAQASKS